MVCRCVEIRSRALNLTAGALSAALLVGCNGSNNPHDADREASGTRAPSAWRSHGDAKVIAVAADRLATQLAQATAEARATADDARKRWSVTAPEQRERWSVKWAAPTSDHGVEHVWVTPVLWSEFRIEGVLASEPIAELASGKRAGQLVSFPIEELSDWLHMTNVPGPDGRPSREGSFTLQVLEQHYGKPAEASSAAAPSQALTRDAPAATSP